MRLLPPTKDLDPTDDDDLELDAADILESNDIDSFEAAAARIRSFEAVRTTEPSRPVAATDQVEPAPVSVRVHYASPQPSTLLAVPAAPVTSPLPLEAKTLDEKKVDDKSVDPKNVDEKRVDQKKVAEQLAESRLEPKVIVARQPERTLEMRGDAMARVAQVAALLDEDGPGQTQVIARSQLPASLQAPPVATARNARPSSIAPVALDLSASHPPMPSSIGVMAGPRAYAPSAATKPGMSGALIAGLAVGAVALLGVVGLAGYMASRPLSERGASLATAPAPEPAAPGATANRAAAPADLAAGDVPSPAAVVAAAPSPAAPSPAAPSPAAIDVSSLPSAPVRGGHAPAPAAPAPAAPRGVVGSNGGSHAGGGSPQAATTSRSLHGTQLPPPRAANREREAPLPASAGGAVALPPPPPKPVVAPVVESTGNVNVDSKLRAVVVDGSFRRVNDGVLTLSCGPHRIKVGMNDPQLVNVPCGGSVNL